MKKELDISEVKFIIRNLIRFIVVEGKQYVSDAQKKAYVSEYVQVLIKTIYMIDEKEESSIVEDIAEDITRYLK